MRGGHLSEGRGFRYADFVIFGNGTRGRWRNDESISVSCKELQMLRRSLQVAIASDTSELGALVRAVATEMGLDVVCEARSGRELVDACREKHIELVIAQLSLPDRDGIAAIAEVARQAQIAAVLIASADDPDLLQRLEAGPASIVGCVCVPFNRRELEATIRIAISTYRRIDLLRLALEEAEERLADAEERMRERKLVERAKGILMSWTGMQESDAYRRLQRMARDKNWRLVDAAQKVISLDGEPAVRPTASVVTRRPR